MDIVVVMVLYCAMNLSARKKTIIFIVVFVGGWVGGGGLSFRMVLCVGCFGGTVLYVCIEYNF